MRVKLYAYMHRLKRSAKGRYGLLLSGKCRSKHKKGYAIKTIKKKTKDDITISLKDEIKRLFTIKQMAELACGRQAFIATWLFDPSMSALPIILKQNSVSVGLFTLLRERELGLDRRETG